MRLGVGIMNCFSIDSPSGRVYEITSQDLDNPTATPATAAGGEAAERSAGPTTYGTLCLTNNNFTRPITTWTVVFHGKALFSRTPTQ